MCRTSFIPSALVVEYDEDYVLTREEKRGKMLTLPVCVVRFSILTSSPFATGTGSAKVKVTDAKSAQARMKSAKRDMGKLNWIG